MQKPSFWEDKTQAKIVSKKVNILKNKLEKAETLQKKADDLQTYILLLKEEESGELFSEAIEIYQKYLVFSEKVEIEFLLNKETDVNDAIITIHPGAGGTESQDWAQMLMRMYVRWAEKNNFKVSVDDLLPGDEAGIKSVTMEISGEFAFGFLKCESGVHRLVRISPFNAQGKRQTSFASIFVYPIIEDDIDVEINPNDLKIDTYRASGAGGQHVNTTDSAIRITHVPTNIVVQCQKERSQIKNKDTAMKVLRSRLFQLYEEEKEKEKEVLEQTKTDIGWGNQIRSYVFHPYQMVKDHRTQYETGNTGAVMDGSIDDFIFAFLKKAALKISKEDE